jgi:hypothetical protein
MPILKPKKETDSRFVGVLFDQSLRGYLSLYVLAKDTDKSKVIRSVMENWRVEQQEEDSEQVLIQAIVKKIWDEWLLRRAGYLVITFVNFKKEVEYELMDKGLGKEHIEAILAELDRNETSKKPRTT